VRRSPTGFKKSEPIVDAEYSGTPSTAQNWLISFIPATLEQIYFSLLVDFLHNVAGELSIPTVFNTGYFELLCLFDKLKGDR